MSEAAASVAATFRRGRICERAFSSATYRKRQVTYAFFASAAGTGMVAALQSDDVWELSAVLFCRETRRSFGDVCGSHDLAIA